MNQEFEFLNLDGLEDHESQELLKFLCSTSRNPDVTFPWDLWVEKVNFVKGDCTFLNVYAPAFESTLISNTHNKEDSLPVETNSVVNGFSFHDTSEQIPKDLSKCRPSPKRSEVNGHNQQEHQISAIVTKQKDRSKKQAIANASKTNFKLDPTVSSFVPQSLPGNASQAPTDNSSHGLVDSSSHQTVLKDSTDEVETCSAKLNGGLGTKVPENELPAAIAKSSSKPKVVSETVTDSSVKTKSEVVKTAWSAHRSFADVLKSNTDNRTASSNSAMKCSISVDENYSVGNASDTTGDDKKSNLKDDKMAIPLARHLHNLQINYSVICLQPRGFINRNNWCYVNATLQAFFACCPLYSLLRDLPIGPTIDRGTSSTPILDSMVKLSYEFVQTKGEQEELQTGSPFQPTAVYKMLGIVKPLSLKGLQEDAEEFLSYILNGMHEEMVTVMKNYERLFNLNSNENLKANGHIEGSDNEDEWQVMGAKQRGMVTRKVVEHRTPISDLLGGQIKSFLTSGGNKTSASVQPFFALQLDIQSESVTTVEEALSQMTVKEPIVGYTCPKTKQEVEAYSRILLQKLPPVLILHLKRFVYNRNGGCKKVMKHTEYPINLELKKDLFTPEARKTIKLSSYKLFAVMYHEGAEAGIGHYICDRYHAATKNWVRCDDRTITAITEAQVLSHSPPRVPYLLFYQACNPKQENSG